MEAQGLDKVGIKNTLINSVYLFLFYCYIGWLYEVVLAFIYGYGFINRGFLWGPYLPLYGFGALLLIFSLKKVMERPIRVGKIPVTPLIVFVLIILITTALEYGVGIILESIFNQRWWDYSTYDYNFQGLICLSASIRFGFGGMLFLYILYPLFLRIIGWIPEKYRAKIALVIVAVFIGDLIWTLYYSAVNGFNPVLAQPR